MDGPFRKRKFYHNYQHRLVAIGIPKDNKANNKKILRCLKNEIMDFIRYKIRKW